MKHLHVLIFALHLFTAGCAPIAGNRMTVVGVGEGDLLKLRTGPGLEYGITLGLPDGTALIRRKCVTEVGQLWCRVSPAKTPSFEGYVSADYLSGI